MSGWAWGCMSENKRFNPETKTKMDAQWQKYDENPLNWKETTKHLKILLEIGGARETVTMVFISSGTTSDRFTLIDTKNKKKKKQATLVFCAATDNVYFLMDDFSAFVSFFSPFRFFFTSGLSVEAVEIEEMAELPDVADETELADPMDSVVDPIDMVSVLSSMEAFVGLWLQWSGKNKHAHACTHTHTYTHTRERERERNWAHNKR